MRLVVELANSHDHPVPEREQLVVGRTNLGATRCAAPDLGADDQNIIASTVDDPLDLKAVVTETLQPLLEPPPDSLAAPIGRPVLGCAPLDVGVAERHDPGDSPQKVRLARGHLVPTPRNLHVLLRHRSAVSRGPQSRAYL